MTTYPATLSYRNDDGHQIEATITPLPGEAINVDLSEATVTGSGGYSFRMDVEPYYSRRRFLSLLDAVLDSDGGYQRVSYGPGSLACSPAGEDLTLMAN